MRGAQVDSRELIWLCGRPRFLRETLAQLLQETFRTIPMHQVADLEPPTLKLPPDACWLIWFLNGTWTIPAALEKIVMPPARLNLLLIQSDGRTLVRWANQQELTRSDISLPDLVRIIKTTLDEWQSPFRSYPGAPEEGNELL